MVFITTCSKQFLLSGKRCHHYTFLGTAVYCIPDPSFLKLEFVQFTYFLMLLFNHFMAFCSPKIPIWSPAQTFSVIPYYSVKLSASVTDRISDVYICSSLHQSQNLYFLSKPMGEKQTNSPKQQQKQQEPSILRYLQDSVNFFSLNSD